MTMSKECMPIIDRKARGQLLFWWKKEGRVRTRVESKRGEKRQFRMSKRRRFVMISLALTVALYVIQKLSVEARYLAILGVAALSYGLSLWALRKDLAGIAYLTDLTMPTLYPVAVALFYFLLPQLAVTRVVVLIVFAISMYALLLTANIFAVASNRTIQLLRAARTVGFLLTVVTSALLFHVVFSLNMHFWLVGLSSILISFPVFLQGIWGYTLANRLGAQELYYSAVGSLLVLEATMAISFWLIEPLLASVILAMMVYVLLGIYQHEVDKRLFGKTVQEFGWFALIVFLIVTGTVIYRWAL